MYPALKNLHVACVLFSGFGFALRGVWMLSGSAALNWRLTKVLPHLIDTALLSSALAMAVMSSQYPFEQNWLTAKLIGLVVYVMLGTVALKRGRTRQIRAVALILAVLAYAYVVNAALSRSPLLYWG